MPRRRVPTRISDADARQIAGHLMFAAAAETLGGVYGTVALERELRFTPAARAKAQAKLRATETATVPPPGKSKATLPTGTCKKWLKGHVPFEQTLGLIAESHPKTATRMQHARDCDIVRALTVANDDVPFVGRRMVSLSPELFGEYLGCMVLGLHNPHFMTGLAAGLLHLAMEDGGEKVLAVLFALDRQLPSPRPPVVTSSLDQAFRLALKQGTEENPEVDFAKEAITEVWLRRTAGRERLGTRPKVSHMFATKKRKLPMFATN